MLTEFFEWFVNNGLVFLGDNHLFAKHCLLHQLGEPRLSLSQIELRHSHLPPHFTHQRQQVPVRIPEERHPEVVVRHFRDQVRRPFEWNFP